MKYSGNKCDSITVLKFILWFILTAAVYGALFAAWIPLRKKNKSWISIVGIVSETLLAVVCAYLDIALDTLLPRMLQLFSMRLIYPLAVDHIYGDYHLENTDIYVTSGISGWCFPLRSEAHCNYEVIDLKKE